jgi:predicted small lipoprotein YifL
MSSRLCRALFVVALSGCGASSPDGLPPSDNTQSSKTNAQPLLTVTLLNGHTVEFYEWDKVVLVSEVGSAEFSPMTPALKQLAGSGRYVELFSALRPDLSIPATLLDLQARHPPRPEASPETDFQLDSLVSVSGDAGMPSPGA